MIEEILGSTASVESEPKADISVTRDKVEATITKTEYSRLGRKTTVALLTLVNGFEVVGTSSCVDPAKYNEEIGNKIARDKAFDEVWKLEGYSLQKSHPV